MHGNNTAVTLAVGERAQEARLEDAGVLIGRAHGGDRGARKILGERLLPIIQRAVVRRLYPLARACTRDPAHDRDDFIHGVWLRLFEDDWRVLRGYQSERGTLEAYVATVADRHVLDVFRSKARDPYKQLPMDGADLEARATPMTSLEPRAAAREELERLYDYLCGRLDARGILLFHMLEVDRLSVVEVCERAQMSRDALYQWRVRLRRIVRDWRAAESVRGAEVGR